MQIYVGKNGQQLGPFSLDEVNRKVADGTFTGSDLAWYEGAAGWAPLSGVPGVNIRPAAVAPAVTPAPAAVPVQPAAVPTSTPAPIRPNASIVQPPSRGGTGILALVSWALLGITLVVSFIPFVGCFGWVLGILVAVAVIIMGIVMLTRGRGLHGSLIILAGILIVPICFAAQFLSLAAFGGTYERKQQTQILENLRTVDAAKVRWVSETKASNGTPVTMAKLEKQLNGKTVTPAAGETYDPMPVGQTPTATLPSDKTLGKFKGSDVLTIANLETAVANSSIFDWIHRITPSPSPSAVPALSPTPSIAPSVSALPKPSAAPSVTAAPSVSPSPRPSTSPRSSSSPHLLISPRQSIEPRDSPSSRPSPSAKFAPRVNPRQSPGPSEDQSQTENSGGPKAGRQYPRESPGETPEPSPDDDDE
jgi:GYF domain 2